MRLLELEKSIRGNSGFKKFVVFVSLILLFSFYSEDSFAKKRRKTRKGKTKIKRLLSSNQNIKNTLKVRGQSRNLNMMLVLKNKKDKTNFVKLRTDYKQEIMDSVF